MSDDSTITILALSGEISYTMPEFVAYLKDAASNGEVQILGYGFSSTTILVAKSDSNRTVTLSGAKEKAFWDEMERSGWSSGQNPFTLGGRSESRGGA